MADRLGDTDFAFADVSAMMECGSVSRPVVQGTRIEEGIRWPASTKSTVGMKKKRGGRPDPFVEDPLLEVFACDR